MIYITGDIHGNPIRFSADNFYEQKEMNHQEENFVIVLGDFGLVWNAIEESSTETYWLDWLENKPFTTLFIDGNHENHVRLNTYPISEWHGGKVHKIRPHVLHLMRGEVFDIEGLKFFAFGGASSHDISDGILDSKDPEWKQKAKQLDKQGKNMYRIKGLSWWEEELPSEYEMLNGVNSLKNHDNKVDYIITHCASSSTAALLSHGMYKPDYLTDYFETIRYETEYKCWLFGHYHQNRQITDKDICIYEQIVRVN